MNHRIALVAAIVASTFCANASDRTAAEWTLLMGGTVRIAGHKATIRDVSALPPGDFVLEVIDWVGVNGEPSDLERLSNLPGLKELRLPGPLWNRNADSGKDLSGDMKFLAGIATLEKLTFSDHFLDNIRFRDAGLEEIRGLRNLRELGLRQAQIKGTALGLFPTLRTLDITLCPVEDKGFGQIAAMKGLRRLWAGDTLITDGALGALAGLTELEDLDLHGTEIGDAGLEKLRGLSGLRKLNLQGANITDVAISYLAGMKHLEELNLYRTKVSNAGLAGLKNLKELRDLDVRYTRATTAGVDELRAALPGSRIVFAGGASRAVRQPVKSGLTLTAWIESLGGKMKNDSEITLASSSATDQDLDRIAAVKGLRSLDLEGTETGDLGVKRLAKADSLRELNLSATAVSDAGVEALAGLKDLRTVHLGGTYVEGKGLKALTTVEDLSLTGSPVNDAGLAAVGELKGLRRLSLAQTDITDAGLVHLQGLNALEDLDLTGTDVGDVGMGQLGAMPQLAALRLRETRITSAGVAHLAALKKLRSLDLSRTRLTNEALTNPVFTGLRSLRLDYAEIDDDGLKHLAGFEALEELGLDSTNVTDKSIQHLKRMTRLKKLDLYHTLVTAKGVAELRAALPNCRIVWDKDSSLPNRRRA